MIDTYEEGSFMEITDIFVDIYDYATKIFREYTGCDDETVMDLTEIFIVIYAYAIQKLRDYSCSDYSEEIKTFFKMEFEGIFSEEFVDYMMDSISSLKEGKK